MLLRGAAQGTAGMAGQSVESGRTLLTWREGNRSSGFLPRRLSRALLDYYQRQLLDAGAPLNTRGRPKIQPEKMSGWIRKMVVPSPPTSTSVNAAAADNRQTLPSRACLPWIQMTASSPLRSMRLSNFSDGPLGLLSPTSHFCTVERLVFSTAAKTA